MKALGRMPKLAKTIEIVRQGQVASLFIDGEEFGYYIAREPIVTTTDADSFSTVNLTLVAERITVDDDSKSRKQHGVTNLGPDEARDALRRMNDR